MQPVTELPLWRRQFYFAAACLGSLLLAMAAAPISNVAFWALISISFVAGIRYPLAVAVDSLKRRRVDVDFLMLLVAIGAWVIGHPEEGALLLVLFTGSRAMESYAEERTKNAIEALTEQFPTTARRITDDREEEIRVEAIVAGDMLLIRPGEYFPVDCRAVSGNSAVDLSAITGEEEALMVSPDTEVLSGGVNGSGLITAQALRPASESSYQKILRLIQNAPARKAPAQIMSERVGRYFTLGILAVTALAFTWWYGVARLDLQPALYRAMALLVAGSPCALVLSIPSGVLAAIAKGARHGILFHGGRGLLGAASARTIAFDKTGTLTTGEPSISSIDGPAKNNDAMMMLAARLAMSSTHPAARAVLGKLNGREASAKTLEVEALREEPGIGVFAEYQGETYLLGRAPDAIRQASSTSMVVLSRQEEPLLMFHLRETPRVNAACVMAWLRIQSFRLMLLSGDSPQSAARMGQSIGIDDARGGLKPAEKYAVIEETSQHGPVIMVGDGVNDAPALARADVAVAMGMRGSAAALAQADIVLVNDRLMDLVYALELSNRARRIIRQNIAIAVGAATVLVAFALVGKLPLALGVFGHEGGTVLVVLNSLRLLTTRRNAEGHRLFAAAEA